MWHVAGRKPASLDSAVECVRGRSCCDHWQGRIAVAAIHCLIKVRLLSFRRKPGRGAATLAVDDHQRQFRHDRKANSFPFEGNARTGGGSNAELARIACADRRSEEHTSELQSLMRISYAVFCLKKKNTIKHKYITSTYNQQ